MSHVTNGMHTELVKAHRFKSDAAAGANDENFGHDSPNSYLFSAQCWQQVNGALTEETKTWRHIYDFI